MIPDSRYIWRRSQRAHQRMREHHFWRQMAARVRMVRLHCDAFGADSGVIGAAIELEARIAAFAKRRPKRGRRGQKTGSML